MTTQVEMRRQNQIELKGFWVIKSKMKQNLKKTGFKANNILITEVVGILISEVVGTPIYAKNVIDVQIVGVKRS